MAVGAGAIIEGSDLPYEEPGIYQVFSRYSCQLAVQVTSEE
jgi:hypothetical protein